MLNLGHLMKTCMAKMTIDQKNAFDKDMHKLLEKIPEKYHDMKYTDVIEVSVFH